MTWQAIARKDFRDAVRSKWLWGLSAVFIGLFAGTAYFLGSNASSESNGGSLSTAFSTSSNYTLRTVDGTDVGSISMHRDGLFFAMNVTLERSDVPTELLLAMAYGMFWGLSQ